MLDREYVWSENDGNPEVQRLSNTHPPLSTVSQCKARRESWVWKESPSEGYLAKLAKDYISMRKEDDT